MAPAELRERAAGRLPALTVHVYPPVPPLAAKGCEYAVPTTRSAAMKWLPTIRRPPRSSGERLLWRRELSATCTVKLDVPAADGVPLITPAELSDRAAGSVPALTVHVYPPVPPLAAKGCEYAVPATPFGSEDVVTDRAAATTIVSGAGLLLLLHYRPPGR